MIDFVGKQVGKLLWWLFRSILIGYCAGWLIGTMVEMIHSGNIISPMWILEIFW